MSVVSSSDAGGPWGYDKRQQLAARVTELNAEGLRRVLVLIFGDAPMRPNDEFTVDFERLDAPICDVLDDYVGAAADDRAPAPKAPAPGAGASGGAEAPEPSPSKKRGHREVEMLSAGPPPSKFVKKKKVDPAVKAAADAKKKAEAKAKAEARAKAKAEAEAKAAEAKRQAKAKAEAEAAEAKRRAEAEAAAEEAKRKAKEEKAKKAREAKEAREADAPADEALARMALLQAAAKATFGALPARLEVRGGGGYEAASVIAQAKRGASHRHLALFDGDLSLQWLDASGPRKAKWRAVDAARAAPSAAGVGPATCDAVLSWLVSLDVAEPLLHMDPHLRTLLPRHVAKCRDLPGGSTLQRCRDRLARRAYVDAGHFAADVRAVHATVLALCAKTPPPSWRADGGTARRSGPDLETILHCAQVFASAFETKWAAVLATSSSAPGGPDARAAAAAWRAERSRAPARGRGRRPAARSRREAALGRAVEVYWDGEDEWFRGVLAKYRDRDDKHWCDYDDGTSEWIRLADHAVRLATGDAAVGAPPAGDGDGGDDAAAGGVSCQKLGMLVWAKSGAYPWWPGEVCLQTVDEIMDAFPPGAGGDGAHARKCTVLYFGETQFDMVEPESRVRPFDAANPRELAKVKPPADLKLAIKLAIARSKELRASGADDDGGSLAL
ncbi:hypothetical protein SO694_00023271 [Aureococcus anophagefferens]|uniref:PWWP domain-containing protein n=1 Tax=Aureococcus anophagefferens TaxID=44056 RepID=A0ABR1FTN2_AURAN